MFLQEAELVAHASQGLGHMLLVPPARHIWAQVDTKSNGRSPLLVPVLSRTTIVSQDHLCIIWVKRMYASKVPFPRSSRHDQFQDLSPRHKKKGRKCTWHRIKGSGTTVSHQWSMNIQGTWSIFAWIVSWRVGDSPKWWYTIIPHSHLITHLLIFVNPDGPGCIFGACSLSVPFPGSLSRLRPVSFHCCLRPRRGANEKRTVEGLAVEMFNRAWRMSW